MESPSPSVKRILYSLRSLLKTEEINSEEYNTITSNSHLFDIIQSYVPEVDCPTCEDEEALKGTIRTHMRAYLFSNRECNAKEITYNLQEFEKALELQKKVKYQELLQAVYKTYNNFNFEMRAHFFFITNLTIFNILITLNTSYIDIIKFVRPLLKNKRFKQKLYSFDESEEFSREVSAYIKMALEIKNPAIFEVIVPCLRDNLIDFAKEGDKYCIELSEEIIHKIRKDITVSIDIIIPKKIFFTIIDNEVEFSENVPWAKLTSYGGFWLASIAKFRPLTPDEKALLKKKYRRVKTY